MIVVTAPTGQIGHHVVTDLLAANASVRLIVRDAGKLPGDVRERVEVVEGSHGDAAVVERALDGAKALFWLVPPNPRSTLEEAYLDFTRPAAEALRGSGVRQIVAVTALGRGTRWQDHAGLVTASLRMGDMIMASGVAFRGLAMPGFMENLLWQAAAIRNEGVIHGPLDADRKVPATATRDMGAVAARLLADEGWTGQEDVPVLGPEDLSMNDMAVIVSEVLGREVRYRQIPLDALKAQQLDRGSSESFAQGYVDMLRAKNEGMDNAAERTTETRTSTTFRQWCEEELKPAVLG